MGNIGNIRNIGNIGNIGHMAHISRDFLFLQSPSFPSATPAVCFSVKTRLFHFSKALFPECYARRFFVPPKNDCLFSLFFRFSFALLSLLLSLGTFRLATLAGGTGLLRLGEPAGGNWGNRGERVPSPASLRSRVRTL